MILSGRGRHETLLALALLTLCAAVSWASPQFLSRENLFDLMRGSIVIGILSIGVFVVLASGGIDVSFAAIAVFSSYATVKLLPSTGGVEIVGLAFLLSSILGLALGSVNALFVALFRLPTLIVTLGTLSLFRGFLLTFIGSEYITVLPGSLVEFSRWTLLSGVTHDGAAYRLPMGFLLLPAVALFTWFFLNRTLWGRGIFAMGGSLEAAERAGFPIRALHFVIYGYVGMLSGAAGLLHASLSRMANPFDLVGMELNVIAAVVLGGARITGGYGSVTGTLLGVLMIVTINSSLILLGVPSYWQKVVVGLLILLGTGLTSLPDIRSKGAAPWRN